MTDSENSHFSALWLIAWSTVWTSRSTTSRDCCPASRKITRSIRKKIPPNVWSILSMCFGYFWKILFFVERFKRRVHWLMGSYGLRFLWYRVAACWSTPVVRPSLPLFLLDTWNFFAFFNTNFSKLQLNVTIERLLWNSIAFVIVRSRLNWTEFCKIVCI